VLELRLHEVTSELAVARRALAARDDHDAQMAAELRAAKVSSKSNTVATRDICAHRLTPLPTRSVIGTG